VNKSELYGPALLVSPSSCPAAASYQTNLKASYKFKARKQDNCKKKCGVQIPINRFTQVERWLNPNQLISSTSKQIPMILLRNILGNKWHHIGILSDGSTLEQKCGVQIPINRFTQVERWLNPNQLISSTSKQIPMILLRNILGNKWHHIGILSDGSTLEQKCVVY
jgi:hypothetical protein